MLEKLEREPPKDCMTGTMIGGRDFCLGRGSVQRATLRLQASQPKGWAGLGEQHAPLPTLPTASLDPTQDPPRHQMGRLDPVDPVGPLDTSTLHLLLSLLLLPSFPSLLPHLPCLSPTQNRPSPQFASWAGHNPGPTPP
jgi:hypothetical protein